MAQKNTVFEQTLKQKGYWKYTDIYNFAFEWLKDHGYKIKEKKYTEKVSPNGKEIELEWEASKKVSDYLKFIISLKWHILGLKDAEIERGGKKESTNKGELKIKFESETEKDYEKRWEDNPFWKFLRGIYDKYVIRTTIEEYENRLIKESNDYVKEIKSFLQMAS